MTVSNPNTVHLTILMHLENSIRSLQQVPRGRRGKLLILRFTPRGRRWPRLETTRSCRISSKTASWNAFLAGGGNSAIEGQLAAKHAHAVHKRNPIGVFPRLQSGLVHQAADGEVGEEQTVELLAHQIGGFAAQDDLRSP